MWVGGCVFTPVSPDQVGGQRRGCCCDPSAVISLLKTPLVKPCLSGVCTFEAGAGAHPPGLWAEGGRCSWHLCLADSHPEPCQWCPQALLGPCCSPALGGGSAPVQGPSVVAPAGFPALHTGPQACGQQLPACVAQRAAVSLTAQPRPPPRCSFWLLNTGCLEMVLWGCRRVLDLP